MRISKWKLLLRIWCLFVLATTVSQVTQHAARAAERMPLVPGSGQKVAQVGDDFEDPKWEYYYNLPKSSENLDEQQRLYGGGSKNNRFYEGILRGQPDMIKRVPTPPGGLEGSEGSLLLRSLYTGVPGMPSYQLQQDDFIVNIDNQLGGAIPVQQNPNFVVRVFFPPIAKWERRSGAHFAVRAAVDTIGWITDERARKNKYKKEWGREVYYPGMFIELECKENNGLKYDTAYIRIRADGNGQDFRGPQITTTGWWTFGMSFTPEGRVHYYAKPGIEDFTEKDLITSQYPYGYTCLRFKTFFFNTCNGDDGRNWSTPVIIDDPTMYFAPHEGMAVRRSR
jgi:hypothetical protein